MKGNFNARQGNYNDFTTKDIFNLANVKLFKHSQFNI